MAEQALHLVVFDEGSYGMSMSSPNLPGLIYGRADSDQFWADLDDVLEFAEAPPLPRVLHLVRRYETPEGREYLVAVELDDALAEREATAATFFGALTDEEQRRSMFDDAPTLATGEVLFTVVTLDDTIDDAAGTLGPGQATIVVAPGPLPRSIWTTRVADADFVEDDNDAIGRYSPLSDTSMDSTSTIRELLSALPIEMSRVLAHA
jgi:hypothetical protein